MAHSLGNEVLMNILDACGRLGVEIDHVFMWEGAIPNNCFTTMPKQYLPMILNGQTLNYGYQYPLAHTGAKAFSILYCDHDNILGPMVDDKPAKTLSHWSTQAIYDFYHGIMSSDVRAVSDFGIGRLCPDLDGASYHDR